MRKGSGEDTFCEKKFKNELWTFIGCIILKVAYVKKGYIIWGGTYDYDHEKVIVQIQRECCSELH